MLRSSNQQNTFAQSHRTVSKKSTLTASQSKALALMLEEDQTFLLMGYAGTGKTYLLGVFMQ